MKFLTPLSLLLTTAPCFSQGWQQLGLQALGRVYDMEEYDGTLYITGDFEQIGGVTVNNIARWDGAAWAPVGIGLTPWGYGTCLEVYNNELYVGGYFSEAGGVPTNKIARWNGSSWNGVLDGLTMMLAAKDMLTLGNVLYIGGAPDLLCNTPKVNMVMWNGTAINTVGTGELEYVANPNISGVVHSLTAQEGDLYAGGLFDDVAGLACEGLLRWDGSAWYALPPGLPMSHNLEIAFIDGAMTCAQNSSAVYQWNGASWVDFVSGWAGTGSTYSIEAFNGVPIIGGMYNAGPYAQNPGWDLLGPLAGAPYTTSVEVIGNELYAVGDQAVLVNGNYERQTMVVKWTGAVGVDELATATVHLSPNPASDRITLTGTSGRPMRYAVCDATGRTVSQGTLTNAVDVSRLAEGSFVLRLFEGPDVRTLPFVKVAP